MTTRFADLLPAGVVVREGTVPRVDPKVLGAPREREQVARAVPGRRREHLFARDLARDALRELGVACGAIGTGPSREPLWPDGVVGAITHQDEHAAVAVGRADAYAGLGVDVAADRILEPGVLDLVLTLRERGEAGSRSVESGDAAVVFSVKESIYKVWFPIWGCWLDFQDAEVHLAPDGTWEAVVQHHALSRPLPLTGRWSRDAGLVRTTAVLPRLP